MQPSEPSILNPQTPMQCVLVCQHRTCRKQGSAKVLVAFQRRSLPGITIRASSCMGQCGNGPMVHVLPDDTWYSQVHPDEVPAVVDRHLLHGKPIRAMLYPKLHLDATKPQLRQGDQDDRA